MMQEHVRPSDFNDLAADYDRYRIGYSTELFDALETLGLRRGLSVIDAGCGTGLSAEPLVSRGLTLTGIDPSGEMLASAKRRLPKATFIEGRVEELPFANGSFDGAVSAQSFHWFDSDRAFSELLRVVKPGGPIGVWWKILGTDEPMRALRATAAAAASLEASADPLRGGFSAFYRAPFAHRTLRVLPFIARFRVEDWLGYERSRAAARNTYREKLGAYFDALQAGLLEKHGSLTSRIDVRYTQYLYVGQSAR